MKTQKMMKSMKLLRFLICWVHEKTTTRNCFSSMYNIQKVFLKQKTIFCFANAFHKIFINYHLENILNTIFFSVSPTLKAQMLVLPSTAHPESEPCKLQTPNPATPTLLFPTQYLGHQVEVRPSDVAASSKLFIKNENP